MAILSSDIVVDSSGANQDPETKRTIENLNAAIKSGIFSSTKTVETKTVEKTTESANNTKLTKNTLTGTINELETPTDFIKLMGAGAITINGIKGGTDGRQVFVYKSTTGNLTLNHLNTGAATYNRITTNTGAARTTTDAGLCSFIYDIDSKTWLLVALQA